MSLQCDTPGNMNTGFNDMFICLSWMIDRRMWYWQDHHILFSIFSLSHSVHSGYCNYHTNFSRCLSHHICIYTQETTICSRYSVHHILFCIFRPPQSSVFSHHSLSSSWRTSPGNSHTLSFHQPPNESPSSR